MRYIQDFTFTDESFKSLNLLECLFELKPLEKFKNR